MLGILALAAPAAMAEDGLPLEVFSAHAERDEATGQPVLKIVLTPDGQADFAAFTRQEAGKTIDVLVDGNVVTSPFISAPIDSQWVILTGQFTLEAAENLAERLNASSIGVAVRPTPKNKSK